MRFRRRGRRRSFRRGRLSRGRRVRRYGGRRGSLRRRIGIRM